MKTPPPQVLSIRLLGTCCCLRLCCREYPSRWHLRVLPWVFSLGQIPKGGILGQCVWIFLRLLIHTTKLTSMKAVLTYPPLQRLSVRASPESCWHWLSLLIYVIVCPLLFYLHFLNTVGKHFFTCCLTVSTSRFLNCWCTFGLHFSNGAFFFSVLIWKTS